MAIPAMITGFGEQSANYGAAVGQSLAQLGQQVGQQLAMREYQRQASAALPAMQASFQSALSKIQSGDVSDGYIDLLNTQMQFGSTTNPFIQSAMANFSDLALKAGEMKNSELFRQAQYGGGGGPTTRTTIPGMRVPTAQELADPNYTPDTTSFGFTSSDVVRGGGGDMDARFVGEDNTQGTPDQRRMQAQADQEYRTYEDADRAAAAGLPAMGQQEGFSFGAGVLSQYRPEKKTIDNTREEVLSFRAKPREEQEAYRQEITDTEAEYAPPQGRVAEPFQGMIGFSTAQYIEGPAKGGFKVVSIEQEYDEKGEKIKRKMEPASDDDVNTFNGFVANMDRTNRFVRSNPQLRKIMEAAGGNPDRVDIEDFDEDGVTKYRASIDGQDYGVLSTADDFNERLAIEFLKDAPAVIRRNGWRVIAGEAPAAAPAPAAGGADKLAEARAEFGVAAPTEGAAAPAAPATSTFSKDNPFAKQAKIETSKAEVGGKQAEREKIKTELKNIETQIKVMESREKAPNRLMPGFEAAMGTQEMQMTAAEKAQKWEQLKAEKSRLEKILRTTTGFRRG